MPHIVLEIPKSFNIELAKQTVEVSQQYLIEGLATSLESF
ncbi:hypothetical protein fh0823_06880 [Francisella halioticida]|nr:hypothetical protein fh0823_06880 [Francisella halioticida]